MQYISLFFYPHLFLLMTYVGVQSLRRIGVIWSGTLLGGNFLTFLISQVMISPKVLPTQYRLWSDQTEPDIFWFLPCSDSWKCDKYLHALEKEYKVCAVLEPLYALFYCGGMCVRSLCIGVLINICGLCRTAE